MNKLVIGGVDLSLMADLMMMGQHKSSPFNCVYVKLKLATLSSLMYSEEFDA